MSNFQLLTVLPKPSYEHVFNKERNEFVTTTATNQVEVYKQHGADWILNKRFSDHDKIVTCVDWSPVTNRIVTCSQDRNAYVYEKRPDGSWKQTLVLLRLTRAATFVRWSPKGDKFAVGSGARVVSVCYFEEENDWWVSKHLKRPLRSTILSLDWHPNNVLLAAGCADRKTYVLSAYIRDVDEKPEASVWGSRLPFNTVCAEYPSNGWIHSVQFSPSGNALAYTSHDSSLSIVYPSAPEQPPRAFATLKIPQLPLHSLLWVNETTIVAAGYNYAPLLFQGNESGWSFIGDLDPGASKTTATQTGKASEKDEEESGPVSFSALRSTFRNMDLKGSSESVSSLPTVHQNMISSLRPFVGVPGSMKSFTSSGTDGCIVLWNL
ncbi:ARP2/3 actin-organizing complex subunit Sop2 [Schizosaccharomyces octosporus yFS286]|uniref:Actin-related protein 2/3 complex subunit n=1 Tax=Schizosaccharomyces octosporus (strain yFS286) TaxID=483514 RepID=S9Q522_SCHOY|nr:ARP2/3 actin-organizing complex subunit Sop2 [Schizosaccharomyces octosporus yFS286]EPX75122.1 ARP2/3 actin-organizing complex subunit Sop2 [Schizosaccharomyces octosporus yFS286]